MGGRHFSALDWESRPWTPAPPGLPLSRSDRDAMRPSYQVAVPVDIADVEFDVDASALAAADDARAEISRFDADLTTMLPGTEIAPLASVLLRTESASSSQIENITSGARALAIAELGAAKHGSNAELVAANVNAMLRAVDLPGAITPESLLAIHQVLMSGQSHAAPGAVRSQQVWIGGSSASPHRAAFVPPHHSRVASALEDLCTFAARTDVPLLPQAALAHAQFETIHPFNDGNGRTGRALVHAMLRHGGATTRATIPVSAGLLADVGAYIESLDAYRAGNPSPIVHRFAEAAFAAIRNGRVLADDLMAVHDDWSGRLHVRRTAAVWRVLPMLLSRPAITSRLVQDSLDLSQPAADAVVAQLRDAGIVVKGVGRQRYVVWVATDVTRALDDFADRARRRSDT